MKRIYIAFILLSLFFNTSAQYRSGLTLAGNYSWYNEQNSYDEQSAGLGYGLGYRFSWLTKSKFEIAVGPAINVHNTKTKFIYQNYPYYQNHKEPSFYANAFATVGYVILPRTRLMGGYQFGYLLEQDISSANNYDHAALLGVNYDFGFIGVQLSYQHSLNTIQETTYSRLWDADGNLVSEEKIVYYDHKLRALQLSLFIPLNRKKGWDE